MPTALVTGASTGIGRELAFIAAANGYDLALVARSSAPLETVAAEIKSKTSRQVDIFAVDLSVPNAAHTLMDSVTKAGLTVDFLANNAGFGLVGKFWELPEDEQIQMIELNIGALTQLTRLCLPAMVQRRSGYILNVASTAAFQPGPLMSVYYASKAYVVSFSEAVHNEVKEFGVKICCLCPGPTRTEFIHRAGMTNSKLFESGTVMTAGEVAQIGWNAMRAGKSLVVSGGFNATLAFLTRFAPRQLMATVARSLQEPK
jgi:hypothetical protein